jgi:primosomal protein N' (replication factor Y)
MAGIMVQETTRERAAQLAGAVSRFLDASRGRAIRVLGPAPAPVEKLQKTFRHQLLVKSATRPPLHELLDRLRRWLEEEKVAPTRVIIDVDPVSLS